MAIGLVVDLKLDQHTDTFFDVVAHQSSSQTCPAESATTSRDERLAYLGLYYLSAK